MKVAIVGASGQLGHSVQAAAPAAGTVCALSRSDMDITSAESVSRVLASLRPDLVVNLAAYTRVDAAETDEPLARKVNADGARHLAVAAESLTARLIHVSTDFVFRGDWPLPYTPESPTYPVNAYGRSKLEGERAVARVLGQRAVIVRTSWLYSSQGTNFVRTMLKAMAERDEIRVVYDQIGTPTWSRSLADVIWRIVDRPDIAGTYHWCDDGVTSWYDFAVAIQEEALTRGLLHRKVPIRPIRTAEYPTPARRPAYSVLDKQRTIDELGCATSHWRCNLRRMMDEFVDA